MSIAVISEPDDVTVCEGEEAVFICVLNRNINVSIDDLQWHRFVEDTDTTEIIESDPDPGAEIISSLSRTKNAISGLLIITNAMKSYTGYYWVGTSSLSVCRAFLTVPTSMYILCVWTNSILFYTCLWPDLRTPTF